MTSPDSLPLDQQVIALIHKAALAYVESVEGADPSIAAALKVSLQVPRNPDHGDWASNVAMQLAKPLRAKPLDIAQAIVERIPANDLIEPPQIAPPGFINLRAGSGTVRKTLGEALAADKNFGRSDTFRGKRALVEFVSANPTGPLHVGHGRNAVVGDALARIYSAAGYEVEREYYYNDAGVQMGLLGRSLRARYEQACGRDVPFPEDGYKGDYMREIAGRLRERVGESKLDEADTSYFTRIAADEIMQVINDDLARLGIVFDRHFSETTLHKDGRVEGVVKRLQALGEIYEQDGALWLRSSKYGDEKDRVIRKSDGNTTYLTPDIAYHEDKYRRGYDLMVNVLGADHHSYVVRLKAAVRALGFDPAKLHVVLIQMVSVMRGKEVAKLSTRAGDFITLKEILDELQPEVARFFYLLRSPDSQMVFDLELAKQQTMDNPYWYIQYAHARCCSLMAKAEEAGQAWNPAGKPDLSLLRLAEERQIVSQISRLPGAIIEAAQKDEPLPVVNYLNELASAFHAYYSAGNKSAAMRCIQMENPALTQARLALIAALRLTLANGLGVLGLTPITRLESPAKAD